MTKIIPALLLALALMAPSGAGAATISGDYLEARTSDVYTGSCFANSEVNLTGKEAILAWRVREGGWEGVSLQGLNVVAVVKANATLGDPHANPYPARSILVVDEQASAEQRRALVGFARSMAGDLLKNIVSVAAADIEVELGGQGQASLKAGDIAELRTRSLNHGDHLCGNESVYYPPLTEVSDAIPAVTLVHEFRGEGLNGTWSSPGKRSAFIAAFAR